MAKSIRYDAEDTVFAVYDATYGLTPWTWTRYAIGDVRAQSRVFVPPDQTAMLRVYGFTAGEDRTPTPEALARQLRSAAWGPRTRPESPTHHGR